MKQSQSIDFEVQALLFSTWYLALKDHEALSLDFSECTAEQKHGSVILAKFCSVHDKGFTFPSFYNFSQTLTLCEQFLDGSIDVELLEEVKIRSEKDIQAIYPYVEAFSDKDEGGGMGMPMVVMSFGYPSVLAGYIQKNINDAGMVIDLAPEQREVIKKLIGNQSSGLVRSQRPRPT